MEVWKDVVGFEEYYKISSFGNVYSKRTSKIISQSISKTGYSTVSTRIGGRTGKAYCFKVHRLVADAFIKNLDNKQFVNHIDGDKLNNHVDNLEWVTQSENILHAYKLGLCPSLKNGESPHAKLSFELVDKIRNEYKLTKTTQRKLAVKYNVGKTTIQNILANERWI